MSNQWHYSQDGAQYGPVDEAEIVRLIQDGELAPGTPVLKVGSNDWQPARNHACFQVEIYPKKKRPSVQAASIIPKVTSPKLVSGGTSQSPRPATAQPAATGQHVMHLNSPQQSEVFREDDVAVVLQPGCLNWPDRCVKCNAPAHGFRINKTLYWYPWWILLSLVFTILALIIVAFACRKSTKIAYALCPEHRRRRKIGMVSVWVGLVLGFILFLSFIDSSYEAISFLGCGGGLIAAIVGLVLSRGLNLNAKNIDDNRALIKVGRPFLESLPFGASNSTQTMVGAMKYIIFLSLNIWVATSQ